MFSDSCPFCCQWWCPQSPSQAVSSRSGSLWPHTRAGLSMCVCVYIYISPIYIYHTSIYITHLYISMSACAFLHHPTQCCPQPSPCPQGSVALCHPVYDTGRCPLPQGHPSHVESWQVRPPPAPTESPFSDLQGHSVPISSTP